MVSRARAVARILRHAPDMLLHGARRRRAFAAAADPGRGRLLFVCLGNICRSPYAEHAARRRLRDAGLVDRDWQVRSAGFILPGRPSPQGALAVARRRGVDLGAHRSRLLTAELVTDSDLVYAMSAAQRKAIITEHGLEPDRVWVLGDLDPRSTLRRTIRDPFGQAEAVFEAVYDRIDRCVDALVDAMLGNVSQR